MDSLASGTTYRFSIYAYVWSSSFEDTEVQRGPRRSWLCASASTPTAVLMRTSDDIIWSTAATFFYDAYRQYAVIATAESGNYYCISLSRPLVSRAPTITFIWTMLCWRRLSESVVSRSGYSNTRDSMRI